MTQRTPRWLWKFKTDTFWPSCLCLFVEHFSDRALSLQSLLLSFTFAWKCGLLKCLLDLRKSSTNNKQKMTCVSRSQSILACFILLYILCPYFEVCGLNLLVYGWGAALSEGFWTCPRLHSSRAAGSESTPVLLVLQRAWQIEPKVVRMDSERNYFLNLRLWENDQCSWYNMDRFSSQPLSQSFVKCLISVWAWVIAKPLISWNKRIILNCYSNFIWLHSDYLNQ